MGETPKEKEKNSKRNETLSVIKEADQAFQEYSARTTLHQVSDGEKPKQTKETKLGKKIDTRRSEVTTITDSYWTDTTDGKRKQNKLKKLEKLKNTLIASAEEKSDDPKTVAGAIAFVDKNIGNSRSWEMVNDVLKAFPDVLPALARKILGSFSKEIDEHGPLSITDPNAREILKTMVSKVDELSEDQIPEEAKEELTLWNNQLEGNDFHEASLEARKEILSQTIGISLRLDEAEKKLNEQFFKLLPKDITSQLDSIPWHGILELSQTTNAEGFVNLLSQITKKIIENNPDNQELRNRLQGFALGAVEGFLLSQSELGSATTDDNRRKEMQEKAAKMLQNSLGSEVSIHDLTDGKSPLGKEIKRIVTEVGGQNTLNKANELSRKIHVSS